MKRLHTCFALALFVCVLGQGDAWAQSFEQTLPVGFLSTGGATSTSLPFNTNSDTIYCWHYDTSNFSATGPIMINELYVRAASPGSIVAAFNFPDFEITLIESNNDHLSPDPIFANNVVRAEVVRSGSLIANSATQPNNGVVACWIPLRMERGFLYDPTSGNDLIIQLRMCSPSTPFGTPIDVEVGAAGSRYGNLGDCNAPQSTFGQPGIVPIVKMDYTPVMEQTIPQGEMNVNSNSSTSNPVNTLNDQTWQWHYDSGEFAASGPITISQVSVRAFSSAVNVNAFDFNSFEVTLIEASTDYRVATHSSIFANNILTSKVVRSGRWSAPATPASGNPSSTWISFQLTDTFDYDPTTGNDFIIQIRSCAPSVTWGAFLDGVSGNGPGSVGGNRYGDTTNCNALISTTNNNEFVPTAKISYTERTITNLPFKENFDHFGARHLGAKMPNGWVPSSTNTAGWRTHNARTSLGTATSDHTTGKSGLGFYATTDDSLSSSPSESLETPIFNLATQANPIATFWLYSHTALNPSNLDPNVFDVRVRRHNVGGTISNFSFLIPTVRLLQHGCWTKFAVDLSFFASDRVSLVFQGSTDSDEGFYHDFAIDDFCIDSRLPDEPGQAAGPVGVLDINDCYTINGEHVESGAPGPYYACGRPGGRFDVHIESTLGFQPASLWLGPLNVGVATFGVIGQIDNGTPDTTGDGIPESLFVIGNAFNLAPTTFDLFFFTDATGNLDFSYQLSPFLPFINLGTFQAAVGNGGSIRITNAVSFEIVP